MGIVRNVVYLSKAQLDDLIANGTITVDGTTITYSPDDIYMTPTNDSNYIENGTNEDVELGGDLTVGGKARFAAEEITTYTFTKTSGNATVSEIRAIRIGCVVYIQMKAPMTAATSAGSNVIVGTLSGGPMPYIGASSAVSYAGSGLAVMNFLESGAFTIRAIGASYGSNGATGYWRFMFFTTDA